MNKKKILVVSHVNDLSGANKSLLGIIDNLADKVEFIVLINQKEGALGSELAKRGIDTLYYPYSWWYANNRQSKFKRVYKWISSFFKYICSYKISNKFVEKLINKDINLIYTNTSTVDIGVRLAKILNIPHVWHIREFGKEDFGFRYILPKEYYLNKFRASDSIVAISKAIKNKYSKTIDKSKINIIYNGLAVNELFIPLRQHNLTTPHILITGQVSEAKCTDQAILACKKLIEKGVNLHLHVAGDIDWDYLNSKVPNVKNFKWCTLHGQIKKMKNLREKMDIEVVCSRNEAFGRVTVEGMLAGIPVIGSNTGGTLELIDDGVNGMLYEHGNLNDLASKIESLINDEKLYNELAFAGQQFSKGFTIEKTSEKVYKEFTRVLKS